MIENRKQQHIGIFTSDLDKSIEWYTKELGFVLYEKGTTSELGLDYAFVGSEDRSIMYEFLYDDDNSEDAADGKIDHFCFDSQDIDADYAECLKRGYNIVSDGIMEVPVMWENGVRFFKFTTATGQIIEFAQVL